MPTTTLTFYPTANSQIAAAFGGDVGSATPASTGLWLDPETMNGAPDSNSSNFNSVSGIGSGVWMSENHHFNSFVTTTGTPLSTLLSSIPSNAILTEAKATLNIQSASLAAGNVLVYTRVKSALTNAAKGAREGGFALTTSSGQNLALHDQETNPIICSRAGTPLVLADFAGLNFELVVGFLTNGGASPTFRDINIDALTLTLSYSSGTVADRAPFSSGLLSRYRRFLRG